MPETVSISVKDLSLDLANFRTVPQADEIQAVNAFIAVSPDRFWALMDSLIDDGYLPTENILVLKSDADDSKMIVKEGNRRIAALKLVHGYLSCDHSIPDATSNKIDNLPSDWKVANQIVPCTIYQSEDEPLVDRIVTLAHGKGEKAGRDQWNAVARARHNRDVNKANEPALDLLEKYLKHGRNVTSSQAERWAGDFPLTVLDEAMKKISTRLGAKNSPDLAKMYPTFQYRDALEGIVKDIGLQVIRFDTLRNKNVDFATKFGVPPAATASGSGSSASQGGTSASTAGASSGPGSSASRGGSTAGNAASARGSQSQGLQPASIAAPNAAAQGSAVTGAVGKKTAAVAIQDPRAVKRALSNFRPAGNNRQKVETLRKEALELDLNKNPLAFCFLLRSMFEISAKAFCNDHKASGGPLATKSDGTDKSLVDVLRDITKHLITLPNQKPDPARTKALHGSMTELGKPEGILSVTSMNQLIHNPSFSVTASDISTVFGNVFPLLEAMN